MHAAAPLILEGLAALSGALGLTRGAGPRAQPCLPAEATPRLWDLLPILFVLLLLLELVYPGSCGCQPQPCRSHACPMLLGCFLIRPLQFLEVIKSTCYFHCTEVGLHFNYCNITSLTFRGDPYFSERGSVNESGYPVPTSCQTSQMPPFVGWLVSSVAN